MSNTKKEDKDNSGKAATAGAVIGVSPQFPRRFLASAATDAVGIEPLSNSF